MSKVVASETTSGTLKFIEKRKSGGGKDYYVVALEETEGVWTVWDKALHPDVEEWQEGDEVAFKSETNKAGFATIVEIVALLPEQEAEKSARPAVPKEAPRAWNAKSPEEQEQIARCVALKEAAVIEAAYIGVEHYERSPLPLMRRAQMFEHFLRTGDIPSDGAPSGECDLEEPRPSKVTRPKRRPDSELELAEEPEEQEPPILA